MAGFGVAVDSKTGETSMQLVQDAFKAAPVTNLDGTPIADSTGDWLINPS